MERVILRLRKAKLISVLILGTTACSAPEAPLRAANQTAPKGVAMADNSPKAVMASETTEATENSAAIQTQAARPGASLGTGKTCSGSLILGPEQVGPSEAYKWTIAANCEAPGLLSCGMDKSPFRCKKLNAACTFEGKTFVCLADDQTPTRLAQKSEEPAQNSSSLEGTVTSGPAPQCTPPTLAAAQEGPAEAYKWKIAANCENPSLPSCETDLLPFRCKTLNKACSFGGKTIACLADDQTAARLTAAQQAAAQAENLAAQQQAAAQAAAQQALLASQQQAALAALARPASTSCSIPNYGTEMEGPVGAYKWKLVANCAVANKSDCGMDMTPYRCKMLNRVCTYQGKTFACLRD